MVNGETEVNLILAGDNQPVVLSDSEKYYLIQFGSAMES
jgi:hypothetical protein